MNNIILKDHNAYLVIDEWNSKTRKYHYDEVPISRLVPYLGDSVKVVRNFLFRDIFALISEDVHTLEQIFRAPLGGFPLQPWVDESLKPFDSKPIDTTKEGMHSLEFYRSRRTTIYKDRKPCYSEYIGISGLGLGTHEWDKTPKKLVKERFSLSFVDLTEILDLPIVIDNSNILICTDMRKLKKQDKTPSEEWRKSFIEEIDLGEGVYSLYEILHSIFYEISFHGLPETRDEEKEKLNEQMKELDQDKLDGITKKGVNKKTGKKVYYSSDEMFGNMRKEQKIRDEKNKLLAPMMLKQYAKLLKKHGDKEALPVKKYYMANRENAAFINDAKKLI